MATAPADKKVKKPKKDKQPATNAKRFPKKVKRRNQMPKGQHGGMRLILVENVQHVGNQGDLVEVKPGYGRNYLIPHGLATYVTDAALKRIDKHRAKLEALRIARIAELKIVARELEKVSVTIEANATDEGHLYGSVTAVDIAKALQAQKQAVNEEHIKLDGPLKELGLYQVKVQLEEDVVAEVKVWVVPTAKAEA